MLRGYNDSDPAQSKQACLPLQIFTFLLNQKESEKQIATAQLATGALFFAMRSCEYLHIDKDGNKVSRKTKLLRVRNFRFLKDNKILDINNPESIYNASSVFITFSRGTLFRSNSIAKDDLME